MRLIACQDGKLLTLDSTTSAFGLAGAGTFDKLRAGPFDKLRAGRSFSSGLADLDAIAPGGAFARGAIHELLTDPADGKAMFLAMLLADGASGKRQRDGETERRRDGEWGRRSATSFL